MAGHSNRFTAGDKQNNDFSLECYSLGTNQNGEDPEMLSRTTLSFRGPLEILRKILLKLCCLKREPDEQTTCI